MDGYVRCKHSGALLKVQTPEEVQQEKIKQLVQAMYQAMPEAQKKKIPDQLLEVIK